MCIYICYIILSPNHYTVSMWTGRVARFFRLRFCQGFEPWSEASNGERDGVFQAVWNGDILWEPMIGYLGLFENWLYTKKSQFFMRTMKQAGYLDRTIWDWMCLDMFFSAWPWKSRLPLNSRLEGCSTILLKMAFQAWMDNLAWIDAQVKKIAWVPNFSLLGCRYIYI